MRNSILILIAIFISFHGIGQENDPNLLKLSNALKELEKNNTKTKVFIKTDKDIYSPGEKIWFKAEVYNTLSENASSEPELIVMLKSESGQVIADNKYLITYGICSNEITIPSWTQEGNAYLVAFTPKAIATSDASLSGVKALTINMLKRNDYLLGLKMNKKIYAPGDDAKLLINLTAITPGNRREKLIISLNDYNLNKFTEKITVDVNAVNEFKFKIPGKISNGLFLEVRSSGKSNIYQRLPVYSVDDNLVIEFFPEGGTLLTNNLQRILYRSTNPFGEPIEISGKVVDQMNNVVGMGKSMKEGYGLINIMPMPSQKYLFVIESEYGKGQEFELPEAVIDGCIFSLQKTEDSTLKVLLTTNGKYINDTVSVAAFAGGQLRMAYNLVAKEKTNMKISTAQLPRGIINFVVIHPSDGILSERLVYNTPNEDINLDITTHFTPSETDGDIDITIDLSNFISRFGYSEADISIVDKYSLYDQNDYNYHSLMKYQLKSPVPKTVLDIYLTNLELIANEYKYHNFYDLLEGNEYIKPASGKTISGFVTDKNRKPVPKATVMAIQQENLTLANTTTDEKGRFTFDKISKSNDLTIKAFNSSGKKSYTVHLDRTFDESLEEIILLKSFKPRYSFEKGEFLDYYNQNSNLLKLLGNENRKTKTETSTRTEKMLQSGSSVLDVIKMTKPFRLDGNQIVFYGSNNSLNYQSGALIVIDGQKMGTDISVLNTINPFDVKSINISTSPVEIQRYTGLNSVGIIEITTRQKPEDFIPEPASKVSGFQPNTIFDASKMPEKIWKYQTTLFWGTNLVPNDEGKIVLQLKANEIRTEYVVRVEIISESGVRHHQISTFSTKDR
ncbi:MAG: carboxypeptidase regulatory-like domain-containing protein [Prolixibacteraceae bacterium]|nr:carboxypeptidase regulatory-like domain-containing protein [Prolixibacteraceae bacterium]